MRLRILFALLICAAPAYAQLPWSSDWNATFQKARAEDRLVVVEVRSNDCITCEEMERETWSNPVMETAVEPFLLLRIDAGKTEKMGPYTIGSFRGVIVFDPAEQPWFRYGGHQPPEVFVAQLERIVRVKPMLIAGLKSLAAGDAVDGNFKIGDALTAVDNHAAARKAYEQAAAAAESGGDEKNVQIARIRSMLTWVDDEPAKVKDELKKLGESQIREVEMYRQMGLATAHMALHEPKAAKAAYERALKSCPDEMKANCEEQLQEMRQARMSRPQGRMQPSTPVERPPSSGPRDRRQ